MCWLRLPASSVFRTSGPEGLSIYGKPNQQRRLATLGRLLRHDWFSRIWVI